MNHFIEVVDAIGSGDFYCDDQDLIELVLEIPTISQSTMCFYTEFDSLEGVKIIPELCKRMPFEVCWFEFFSKKDNATAGVFVKDFNEYGLQAVIFVKRSCLSWEAVSSIRFKDGEFFTDSKATKMNVEIAMSFLSMAMAFVSAIGCNNISRVEHKPSEKMQKARRKRGKKPFLSFWTLELKNSKSSNESLGGSHLSPRFHLRRGHPRQYSPGKWTWVQSCAVGVKANGMILKDYELAL